MSHRACDFVTEEEYREQLVRHGWPNDEVERLLEDSKQGHSFDVHEFAELADGHRITLHTEREFTTSDHWRHLTLEGLSARCSPTVRPTRTTPRTNIPGSG